MIQFILDSNVFIEAHRANYPLDVAKGFWIKLASLANSGKIISIDKVKNELYANNDELKKWCKDNLSGSFFKNSTVFVDEYRRIVNWAALHSNQYKQAAINEFLDADIADAFIISYALADIDKRFIVTQEISAPQSKNKIKIPDACNNFGIEYLNTIEMFRALGESF